MLVNWVAYPLGVWVTSDDLVEGIHHDDLKVFVGGVLAEPVAVQDTEGAATTSSTLLMSYTKRYQL